MLSNKIQIALLSGLIAALGSATADLSAYKRAKDADPSATFSFGIAVWRWAQGFVAGAIVVLGSGQTSI